MTSIYKRKPIPKENSRFTKSGHFLTSYQPCMDVRVMYLSKTLIHELVISHTNTCREDLTNNFRDEISNKTTNFIDVVNAEYDHGNMSLIIPNRKRVPLVTRLQIAEGRDEPPVYDKQQFISNCDMVMRAFYMLLYNDSMAVEWNKLVNYNRVLTANHGLEGEKDQPVILAPVRFWNDPELISLFIGLWRACYLIADTDHSKELSQMVSHEEIQAIMENDRKTIKIVCSRIAKLFAKIWNNEHSPISCVNYLQVEKLIVRADAIAQNIYSLNEKDSFFSEMVTDEWDWECWSEYASARGFNENSRKKL